jgi:GNAT superfamily N-acetyltransferase
MPDAILMKQATTAGISQISGVLIEAAEWLISNGEKLWDLDDLTAEKIASDVDEGKYWFAEIDNEIAGCIRYQNEDPEYWDDVPHRDSAFIHRVAIGRGFAGCGLAGRMIEWAKNKAKNDGKRYLRLDCADRPKLRAVYEKMGFSYHSVKDRSPYNVIRYEIDLKKLD